MCGASHGEPKRAGGFDTPLGLVRLSREASALAGRPREHPSHGRPQRHRREDGRQGGVGRAQAPWAEHGTGWAPRTGKEEDAEVGLQYFGKRYLNPLLGRWISADPLEVHAAGASGGSNVYAYVSGEVLKNIDPLGLCVDGAGGACSDQVGGSQGTSATDPHGTTPPPGPSADLGFASDDVHAAYTAGQAAGYATSMTPGGAVLMEAASADIKEKLSFDAYQAWLGGAAESAMQVAIAAAAAAEATAIAAGGSAIQSGGVAVLVGSIAITAEAVVAVNAASVLAVATSHRAAASPPPTSSVDQTEGQRRQAETQTDLEAQNPDASVQSEQYLRDGTGKRVKDPETGEMRRLDHVVIKDEKGKAVETTSPNASKTRQQAKERRIREAGGTFVRDRRTKQLVPVEGESEIVRRK